LQFTQLTYYIFKKSLFVLAIAMDGVGKEWHYVQMLKPKWWHNLLNVNAMCQYLSVHGRRCDQGTH
jgi:hypothetical protein